MSSIVYRVIYKYCMYVYCILYYARGADILKAPSTTTTYVSAVTTYVYMYVCTYVHICSYKFHPALLFFSFDLRIKGCFVFPVCFLTHALPAVSHCPTVPLSHCPTAPLSHCPTVPLPHCSVVSQLL